MSALRSIYRATGFWNEHVGRLITLASWLGGAGALTVIVGGFLYRSYGLIGGIAIAGGCLLLLAGLAAWLIDRKRSEVVVMTLIPAEPPPARQNGDANLKGLAQRGIDQLNFEMGIPLSEHRLRAAREWAGEVREATKGEHPGLATYFDGLADGREPRIKSVSALHATLHPLVQRLLYVSGSPKQSQD